MAVNSRIKKQIFLVFLVVSILSVVSLLSSYGIRYFYKQSNSSQTIPYANTSDTQPQLSSQTTQAPNIPESQHPLNLLLDSQLLDSLRSKVFVSTDPLELTEKELQALKLLSSLENSNPILDDQNLRVLKEISGNLVNAYIVYKNIKDKMNPTTPSPEDIKLFEYLSEKMVTCFQEFVKDDKDKFFLDLSRKIKYTKHFDSFIHSLNKDARPVGTADSNLTLEELEEKIVSNYEKRTEDWIDINDNLIESFPAKKLVHFVNSMDDYPFIIFWYSYGYRRILPSRASGRRFLHAITKEKGLGNSIYKKMFENFLLYIDGKLLDELLSTDPNITKADKEKLVSDTMELYYGKFHSIWRRIVKPGTDEFENLTPTFSYYLRLINFDIYGSLDVMFKQISKSLLDGSSKEFILYQKELFSRLVKFLFNDDKASWGLPWLVDYDPYFILFFFHVQSYKQTLENTFLQDIQKKDDNRKWAFMSFLNTLKKEKKLKFNIDEDTFELIFSSDFKSPFPQIMGDEELKSVITKIKTKLIAFCF
jgi:hypothetical protein